MGNGLHVTPAQREHAHEFFQRLRAVAAQNEFTVGERHWPTVAKLVRERLGAALCRRCDDYTLVSTLTGVRGTNPELFAPAMFGHIESPNR